MVLLLPSVGYDFHLSHRFTHQLACTIALFGYEAVRIDWPGHGESRGRRDGYEALRGCVDEVIRSERKLLGIVCVRFAAAIWNRCSGERHYDLPALAIDPILTVERALQNVRRMRRISNLAVGEGGRDSTAPYDDDEIYLQSWDARPIEAPDEMLYLTKSGSLAGLAGAAPDDALRPQYIAECMNASVSQGVGRWLTALESEGS